MKFQIIQNDFTSRALRKEVGQVGFRRQPLFLQYLLRIFGLLCLGVSAFCLVTVGMSIANPGISPWKYTLLTFLYAILFLFLGLRYTNLVPPPMETLSCAIPSPGGRSSAPTALWSMLGSTGVSTSTGSWARSGRGTRPSTSL